MVRLLPLCYRRRFGFRQTILSHQRSLLLAHAFLSVAGAHVLRAADRRYRVLPHRRPGRTQEDAGYHHFHDGDRDRRNRTGSYLCDDRGLGSHPADRAPNPPGYRHRWRMGRCPPLGIRVRPTESSGILRQHSSDRSHHRASPGHWSPVADEPAVRQPIPCVGLASTLHRQHRPGRYRAMDTREARRDPRLSRIPEAGEDRQNPPRRDAARPLAGRSRRDRRQGGRYCPVLHLRDLRR